MVGVDEELDGAGAAQLAQAARLAVGDEHGSHRRPPRSISTIAVLRRSSSVCLILRCVPPGWDTRQLVALLAVVDTGTFSAAALQLGYTQSAVSQQVASLERAVGAPLLVRPGGPRRVRLTPVGESLVVHARAVVARLHAAQADIAQLLGPASSGTLRVGIMQSIGTKVLPRLLRRFREEWPGVELAAEETHDLRRPRARRGVRRVRPVVRPLPLPDGPVRRTPGAGRPVRLPGAGRRAGGGAGIGEPAPGGPAAADRVLRPRPRRRAGPPPAPHRHRARRSSSGPTTTRRSRASSPPASATRSCRGSPWTRTTREVVGAPDRRRPAGAAARRRLARRPAAARRPRPRFIELAVEVCADLGRGWAD